MRQSQINYTGTYLWNSILITAHLLKIISFNISSVQVRIEFDCFSLFHSKFFFSLFSLSIFHLFCQFLLFLTFFLKILLFSFFLCKFSVFCCNFSLFFNKFLENNLKNLKILQQEVNLFIWLRTFVDRARLHSPTLFFRPSSKSPRCASIVSFSQGDSIVWQVPH